MYKYLIKLNVIVIFNKFYIYLNNENLITFITTLKFYKYYVLLFNLINELSIF